MDGMPFASEIARGLPKSLMCKRLIDFPRFRLAAFVEPEPVLKESDD
jgi:hypothetical protein